MSYPVALVLLIVVAVPVGGQISTPAVLWGLLSGVAQAFGVWWFYAALGSGPISVVSPLTAILVAGIPVGVGLALGERPGAMAGIGVVLALVAVVLVSREATDEDVTPHKFTAKVAWLTVGSGVAFGMNFVIIDQVPHEAELWPLVFGRLAATAIVVVAAVMTANLVLERGMPMRLALFAAVLDTVANVATLIGAAIVDVVAGRRADRAVSGGHGAARDRGAPRAGDSLAGGRDGAGSCICRNDCVGLATVILSTTSERGPDAGEGGRWHLRATGFASFWSSPPWRWWWRTRSRCGATSRPVEWLRDSSSALVSARWSTA